jgi:hypothetical protein
MEGTSGKAQMKTESHNQLIIQGNSNGKRQFSKRKTHFENKGTYLKPTIYS